MEEPKRIKLTDNPSHKDLLKTNMSMPLYDEYGYLTFVEIKSDIDELNYKTFWKTLCWENENNSENNS